MLSAPSATDKKNHGVIYYALATALLHLCEVHGLPYSTVSRRDWSAYAEDWVSSSWREDRAHLEDSERIRCVPNALILQCSPRASIALSTAHIAMVRLLNCPVPALLRALEKEDPAECWLKSTQ